MRFQSLSLLLLSPLSPLVLSAPLEQAPLSRNNGLKPVVDQSKLGADVPEGTEPSHNVSDSAQPVSGFQSKSPNYITVSDFDFQSINLATHQEYIELDSFNDGLARFSQDDFSAAGIDAQTVELIRYFAQQEIGHARVLSNMLGARAPKRCEYSYPYSTVEEFIDFNVQSTTFGESGVAGFLNLLDNRAVGQILLQSILTEARQEFSFRQLQGLFPVPFFFVTGIPQAWAWTLLQRYIHRCPKHNTPVAFDIFARLNITNQPDTIGAGRAAGGAALSHNISALSWPGRVTEFSWDAPGQIEGPYHQKTVSKGKPVYAAWVSQYNVTYTDLYDVDASARTAKTAQPGGLVLGIGNDYLVNGTVFVALTTADPHLTPANLSLINDYVAAGPDVFRAG